MKEFTNQDNKDNKDVLNNIEDNTSENMVNDLGDSIKITEYDVEKNEKQINFSDIAELSTNFYAGFFIRMIAYIIDLILVGCISAIFNTLTFEKFDIILPFETLSGDKLFAVITYISYFVIMTYVFGQTLGKMICKIKVENNKGGKLSFSDVVFREIIARFINNSLLLPYLIVPFQSKKKGLHDLIADSVVIKEDFLKIRQKLNDMLKVKEL